MLYEKFTDESDFRKRFVRPLLTRLGFIAVAELHGAQEFGKDFVFSELTPFGFLRHYAAVVKHDRTINQTAHTACGGILSQVRQAFSVAFRLPENAAEQRVSGVVVFNSGKISDNAREWLRAELDEERYGRNVHILDGERLFQLDMNSAFRRGEQLLPRLQGIRNDLTLNLVVWKSIIDSLPQVVEARGSFTQALDNFAASPFLTDRIDLPEVVTLIQECRIIDRISDRYLMGSRTSDGVREQDRDSLRRVTAGAITRAARLLAATENTLKSFRLLVDCAES